MKEEEEEEMERRKLKQGERKKCRKRVGREEGEEESG